MAFDPLTALAVIQGIDTGVGLIKGRQQKSAGETQQALQNVLQTLSPQTQGQQPVRQGQGQGGGFLADPLVKKTLSDLIAKFMKSGEPVSTARAALPDPRQALAAKPAGGGRFGAANLGLGPQPGQLPPGLMQLLQGFRG